MQTAEEIPTQVVGMSHLCDVKNGGPEMIRYAPAGAATGVDRAVDWEEARALLGTIRHDLEDLLHRALCGQGREDNPLMSSADKLAEMLLGAGGFAEIVGAGRHPQLDIIADAAGTVPWEMLNAAGQLHITHLPGGPGAPAGTGRRFLIVADPTGELAPGATGACAAEHLAALRRVLEGEGYEVRQLEGKGATRGSLAEALADRQLGGLYYLGPGALGRGAEEGCLWLADGPLSAGEIRALRPVVALAFLNFCYCRSSADWQIDQRGRSVAEALACGGGKVVLAPLFPLPAVHAVQAASDFFGEAVQHIPLAHALNHARTRSITRWDQGQADLAWMSYRYFGDGNAALPPEVLTAARDVLPGCLDAGHFSFDIAGVLAESVQRRDAQQRANISFTDLLVGLARRGALTRYLFGRLGVDPDRLCERLVRRRERRAVRNEEARPDGLSACVSQILVRVEQVAAEHPSADGRIAEALVLDAMSLANEWDDVRGLPRNFRRELNGRREGPAVDANGQLLLDDLDERARRAIYTAQTFAQQRRAFPIPHRLTLAALLADKDGEAARALGAAGVDPREAYEAMLAAPRELSGAQEPFGLAPELCQRVVLPMLQEARRMAARAGAEEGALRPVSDGDLFRAFCVKAAPTFKDAMRRPPVPFDLDELGKASAVERARQMGGVEGRPPLPEQLANLEYVTSSDGRGSVIRARDFDPRAWAMIVEAARLAWLQGHAMIRSPHLFAGMLACAFPPAQALLKLRGVSASEARKSLLALVEARPRALADARPMLLSPNVYKTLKGAAQGRAAQGRPHTTADDVFAAFWADGGGIVGQLLGRPEIATAASAAPAAPAPPPLPLLARLGRDLIEESRRSELPRIFGRDAEAETVFESLQLTHSPNPLLVGEAGVGRSSIVYHVAQRMSAGQCPRRLRSMGLVEVAGADLMSDAAPTDRAGTRLQTVLRDAGKETILFINGIDALLAAGGDDRLRRELAAVLDHALADRGVRLIATATVAGYEETLLRDRALLRRFALQRIAQISREATAQLLASRQQDMEGHHGVRLSEEATAAALDLSDRHIVGAFWPDKALDLLDRACAAAAEQAEGAAPLVTARHVVNVLARLKGLRTEEIAAG